MNRLDRAAILTELADQLHEHGSWTGETHLQKAVYVLETLLGVDLGLEFVLYKHGPFSFDLRDELTSIRADGWLEAIPQLPYGPTLKTTESSLRLRDERSELLDADRPAISFVASRFGARGIAELEQLSTALWVTQWNPSLDDIGVAEEIRRLKPHIGPPEATKAVSEVHTMRREAESIRDVAG